MWYFYYAVQGSSNFWVLNEILRCGLSNESYWAVLSCGTIYYAVQGGSTFWGVDEILKCALSSKISLEVFLSGVICFQF